MGLHVSGVLVYLIRRPCLVWRYQGLFQALGESGMARKKRLGGDSRGDRRWRRRARGGLRCFPLLAKAKEGGHPMSKERAEAHISHTSCCVYCANTRFGSSCPVCFLQCFISGRLRPPI